MIGRLLDFIFGVIIGLIQLLFSLADGKDAVIIGGIIVLAIVYVAGETLLSLFTGLLILIVCAAFFVVIGVLWAFNE